MYLRRAADQGHVRRINQRTQGSHDACSAPVACIHISIDLLPHPSLTRLDLVLLHILVGDAFPFLMPTPAPHSLLSNSPVPLPLPHPRRRHGDHRPGPRHHGRAPVRPGRPHPERIGVPGGGQHRQVLARPRRARQDARG